jgi:hypothetical protein
MRLLSGDLCRLDVKIQIEEFNFGTYYICKGHKERLQSCQQKAELKANPNPEGRQEVQKTIEPILAAGVITLV